ncbi:sec-independent protein translocase protein TatA [Kineosphaera limosa]|uniref:Sec-independent protein translocase protein TatA n=1 Tax=Kineosphaera limosa NBRC 100340 TaxID=1184609 RepID=K6W5V5_9MICO|nr:Sec-independent protein translocase subunit TatA [Kineosphaera limosa]NYE03223.1 sec-independent protein translocase protein TatA [Kineosphaera limosa]GAB94560.1 Sec-independent protein translocase protein TatA/E homolog [Kineosphaera limosa NBRC 100340]
MGWRGLFEGWHFVILIILIIILFGWKRLPDAARSLGRSMRIFKAEVDEMKGDGRSAASSDTVRGETVNNGAPHAGEGKPGSGTGDAKAADSGSSSPVQENSTGATGGSPDSQQQRN